MTSSIFGSLFSIFDSRSIGNIASHFGESRQAVSQGLESSTACLLSGLASKAGDSSRMSQLITLVSQAPTNINVSDVAGAVTDPTHASSNTLSLLDSGKRLLSLAFGGNQASILDAVGKSAGLRSSVVSTLMGMAAPLMMTALQRVVREDHMTPTTLGTLLKHESEGIKELLPAGVSNLLAAAPVPAATASPITRPVALGTIPETAAPSRSWWWLIPVLLILPVVLFWAYRALYPVLPDSPDFTRFVDRTLPGNVTLNIPQNGVEVRLLAFIQNPSKGVEPAVWFDFDRLLFNTDSATLQPESEEQLRNIATILKAYPNVHIHIGGYTDNSGDAQHNLTLSQDRADGIIARLVGLGISPDRLEATGYGEQFPVADNSTEAGRALNRRVEMQLVQ